ncbi:MAG: polysaccharide biosynthesis tyrosine autokinase [Methylomarinum sp.]|nr:polysaccharide biosynthesis tyrosine autokinase [Methylomarinum sp.]
MNMLEKALEKSKTIEESINKKQSQKKNEHILKQQQSPEHIKEVEISAKKADIVKFDWDYLNAHGFIRLDESHSRIAEEYRSIKRPLVTNALGARKQGINNANLILVTSSIPGEGKTFTSINLAFSIAAELDKKVLLIDADVAKPSVAKVLGIETEIGLIDFLETDSLSLSDIILQTEIPGLRIITAGKSHQFSTELLASDKMIALSKELSERYSDRIVIFDTPPLLATTQAEVLASQMGQIILVIAAETTAQSFVQESVKKLQSCSDVVLGVLNKAQRNLNAGYYGYGHY